MFVHAPIHQYTVLTGEKAIQPIQLPPGSDQGCTSGKLSTTKVPGLVNRLSN